MVKTPKKPLRDTQPSLRDRADALRARMPDRELDPVLAVIKDGRRLLDACRRACLLPNTMEGNRPVAETEATIDLFEHLREVILQTPPKTPGGAVALARYAVAIQNLMGADFDMVAELAHVLKLIAEVRLA